MEILYVTGFCKPTIYTQVKQLEHPNLPPYISDPQTNQKYFYKLYFVCPLCVDGMFSKIRSHIYMVYCLT